MNTISDYPVTLRFSEEAARLARSGDEVVTATIAGPELRERLTDVLNSLLYGLWPPDDCTACPKVLEGCCGPCTAAMGNVAVINTAIVAVLDAATDAIALAVYAKCWLDLPGIGPEQAIDALSAIRLESLAAAADGGGRL